MLPKESVLVENARCGFGRCGVTPMPREGRLWCGEYIVGLSIMMVSLYEPWARGPDWGRN